MQNKKECSDFKFCKTAVQFADRQFLLTLSVEDIVKMCGTSDIAIDNYYWKDGRLFGCDFLTGVQSYRRLGTQTAQQMLGDSYCFPPLVLALLADDGEAMYENNLLSWKGVLVTLDGKRQIEACMQLISIADDVERVLQYRFPVVIYCVDNDQYRRLMIQFNSMNYDLVEVLEDDKSYNILSYIRDSANGLNPYLLNNIRTIHNNNHVFRPMDFVQAIRREYSDDNMAVSEIGDWIIAVLNAFGDLYKEDTENIRLSSKTWSLYSRPTISWLVILSKILLNDLNKGIYSNWQEKLQAILNLNWNIGNSTLANNIPMINSSQDRFYEQLKEFFINRRLEVLKNG